MRSAALGFALLAASAAAALPAAAHHGWGGYEASAPQTLAGTVERVEAGGAHATAWVRVGERTIELVLAPPQRMRSRGLPPESIRPGARVEFLAYPHRSRAEEMRAEWLRVGSTTAQLR
jgi:hypothetical protein